VELTLGHGAFAEETHSDPVLAAHSVGQRQTTRQRKPTTHDRVATIEILPRIEQVHRAAAPARTALGLAIHLGHDGGHRHAPHQRMTMFTVSGHHPVLWPQNRDDPGGNRLFTIVEMQEPADFLLGV